jgi:hypothetical protein
MKEHETTGHYRRLGLMSALSLVAMYWLMYAMVDSAGHVYANVSQFYMAALMAAAMVIIEILVMGTMYPHKRRNAFLLAGSTLLMVASFLSIREQFLVSDQQFLRSMIPHHAGALLMCDNTRLREAEIVELCRTITAGQQAEIEQMQALMKRLP